MNKSIKQMEYKDFYKKICKSLKVCIKDCGLRQYDIAETIGMNRSCFYHKINYGKNGTFNILEIKMICDELLITINELIDGKFD